MARAVRKPIRRLRTEPRRTQGARIAPLRLLVRCFVERKGDEWQAFSLEFGLAAQGSSGHEARRKLEAMIEAYVREALTDDREHAKELLARKGSWPVYAKFYCYRVLGALRRDGNERATFNEPLSLEPRHCPA